MFGNDAQPTRNYRYGAGEPTNLPLVRGQMRQANRYRNDLVAAERARRDRYHAILLAHCPRLAEIDARIEAIGQGLAGLREAISLASRTQRRRTAGPEARARVRDLEGERRQLRAERREVARALDSPAVRTELEASEQEDHSCRLALRHEYSRRRLLYSGTYLAVEQSLQGCRRGPPPAFRSGRDSGRLAIQCVGGLAVPDAFGDWDPEDPDSGPDRQIQVRPVPQGAWEPGAPAALRRTTLRFRVATYGRRLRVWAEVPVVLHRPLPMEARIKWVYLLRERVACHDRWSVLFALARESWPQPEAPPGGLVAVEVGWRLLPSGDLRVACLLGADGTREAVLLPARRVARWRHADAIRSRRDVAFDEARDALTLWLSGRPVPAWLAEATTAVSRWRSAARLAALALRWRHERFAGDAEGFAALERWRRADRRLYEEEANLRRKAIAWRRDLYRNLAARLRRRYRACAVEDANWREVTRVPPPEAAEDRDWSRRHARIAAVGELRAILRETMGTVCEVPAALTTQWCHVCDSEERFDPGSELVHVCSHCGHIWDQDWNAAENLLRLAVREAE